MNFTCINNKDLYEQTFIMLILCIMLCIKAYTCLKQARRSAKSNLGFPPVAAQIIYIFSSTVHEILYYIAKSSFVVLFISLFFLYYLKRNKEEQKVAKITKIKFFFREQLISWKLKFALTGQKGPTSQLDSYSERVKV